MEDFQRQLAQLLDLFSRMSQSMKGTRVTEADGYFTETLAVKAFHHLGSALHLAKGTKLPPLSLVANGGYYDIASIAVLTRAALESYVTLCYLFVSPSDPAVRELRFEAWRLSTLRMRERFPEPSAQGKEHIEAQRPELEALVARLEANAAFQKLDARLRRRILDGHWRAPFTWPQLAEQFAWLPPPLFGVCYGLLSSYAHADFLSAMHLDQADAEATQELIATLLRQALMVVSHLIFTYAWQFQPPRRVLAAAPERAVAERWCVSPELIRELTFRIGAPITP